MATSQPSNHRTIQACLDDLKINGIDLCGADIQEIRHVVHRHLDYFQLMLGGEPAERDVVRLIERDNDSRLHA